MAIKPQLDEKGIPLIGIGTGSKFFARKFKEGLPFTGQVYIDPEALTFKAKGLRRLSIWEVAQRFVLSLKALSFYKSISSKYAYSDTEGDGQQTGGVYVLGPDPSQPGKKKLLYTFNEVDHDPTEFADTNAILNAIGIQKDSSSSTSSSASTKK